MESETVESNCHPRYVKIRNVGSVSIDIYITCESINHVTWPYSRFKLGTINPNNTIKWQIPHNYWSGNFRVGEGANATLAAFSFNLYDPHSKYLFDRYHISTIPPASPNTCTSYSSCVRYTDRTGFNVPLKIISVHSPEVNKPLVCTRAGDPRAMCFPKDTSKMRRIISCGQHYCIEFGAPTVSNRFLSPYSQKKL